jgi:Tol biopolymer transport system component
MRIVEVPLEYISDPEWSPDGTRVVFQGSAMGPVTDLYVMNANGSRLRPLLEGWLAAEPTWSPDGKRIAFYSGQSGGIHLVNADGGPVGPLVAMQADGPSWSPDGRLIAFSAGDASRREQIFTIRPDGSSLSQLTRGPWDSTQPAWSPDGTRIAFIRSTADSSDLFVMTGGGADLTQLTDDTEDETGPTWSPDGEWIAFGAAYRIYAVSSNGSERRLIAAEEFAVDPDWKAA